MDAYTPDLTGEALEYYVDTYQRMIFKSPQKIEFSVPVYYNDKLEVIMLGTVNEVLIEGIDYLINANDYADDAIAVCKSMNPDFNKILIKSLTVVRSYSQDYRIQAKFNQLFVDHINYARINQAQQLEVTPILIGNMLEQIDYLQQMVLNPSTIFSPQSAEVKILEIDISGNNPHNYIIDERHDVNTLNGVDSVRPIYGAFFRNTVIIKNALTDEVFTPNMYQIIEADLPKTKLTSNPSGIYRTIKILVEYVGEVKVTYRAFGGSTDTLSMKRMLDRLITVEDYLSSTSYITPKTLPADPAIIAMNNKIKEMESTMRLLLQNGLPSYGDVSTGTAVVKKIVATDSLHHWWNIASLYRVDGSVDNVLADVFRFRLKSLMSNLMFECTVAVNFTGQVEDTLEITCDNELIPEDALYKYVPKLRIIKVNTAGIYSGVILQLGLKLGESILQDTFAIEDMSGKESCWKLIAFTPDSVPPEDTGVLMPDGSSVFTYGSSDAYIAESNIPFKRMNVLLNNSNIPLTVNGTTTETESVVQTISYLDLDTISSITSYVRVNIGSTPFDIKVVLPISFCDMIGRSIQGNVKFEVDTEEYTMFCKIFFDTTTSTYAISYELNGSTANTFNVIKTQINQ